MVKARVYVTLKKSVFDPQGKTIHDALHSLGYDQFQDFEHRGEEFRRLVQNLSG